MAITCKVSKSDKGVVGALIDLETNPKLVNIIAVLSRFTYRDNQKLTPEEALAVYREFSIEDLEALTESFKANVAEVRNEAAPPPNSVG